MKKLQLIACLVVIAIALVAGFKRRENARIDLIVAASKGNIERVRTLLDEGADINVKDRHGRTALKVAVADGNLAVVELLIARGAKVNDREKDGGSLLMV